MEPTVYRPSTPIKTVTTEEAPRRDSTETRPSRGERPSYGIPRLQKPFRLFLPLLLLGGCATEESSGNGGYLATADSAAITFHAEQLQHFAEVLSRVVMTDGEQATVPTAPPALGAAFADAANCEPVTTGIDSLGEALDADQDGEADDYKVDYGTSCVVLVPDTTRTTLSGFERDRELNTPNTLVSQEFTQRWRRLTENLITGASRIIQVDRIEVVTITPNGATFTRIMVRGDTTILHTGERQAFRYQDSVVASFDPDSGEVLIPNGLNLHDVPGRLTLNMDRRWSEGRPGKPFPGNYHWVVSTPVPLHFDPTSGLVFTGGQLLGLLNGDPEIGFRRTYDGWPQNFEILGATP